MATVVEQADRISRRRSRLLLMLSFVYVSQQASYFSDLHEAARPVDHVKVGAWVLLSLCLFLLLTTKGFGLRSREVRELLDDETTRAHRAEGMKWGFVMALLTAIALYFIDQFEPMSARVAIHAIVSLGLGAALIRFGLLERRAHRDG